MKLSESIRNETFKRLKEEGFWKNIVVTSFKPHPKSKNLLEVTMKIDGKRKKYLVSICTRSVPQNINNGIWLLKSNNNGLDPMLIIPALNQKRIDLISNYKIDCLDLNGNYLINNKNKKEVNLSKENKYLESNTIKSAFTDQGNTLGIALINGPKKYDSMNSLHNYLHDEGFMISFSSLSKRLKVLEQLNLIKKIRQHKVNSIELKGKSRLLDQIRIKFGKIHTSHDYYLKINKKTDRGIIHDIQLALENVPKWTATGIYSLKQYPFVSKKLDFHIYTSSISDIPKNLLSNKETPIKISLSNDPRAYIGKRNHMGFYWSSPILSYLELIHADKDFEILNKLKTIILVK